MSTDTVLETEFATVSAVAEGQSRWSRILLLAFLERLCYYGVRSILVLFLVQRLLLPHTEASALYEVLTMLIYLLPVLGAWFADRWWGPAQTVRAGCVLLMLGAGLLAVSALLPVAGTATQPCMLAGLGLLAGAVGLFKPAYYAAVGHLTRQQNAQSLPLFFWVMVLVNLGAFVAPALIGVVAATGDPEDFQRGFILCAAVAVATAAVAWGLPDADFLPASAAPRLARKFSPGLWLAAAVMAAFAGLLLFYQIYHRPMPELLMTLLEMLGAVVLLLSLLIGQSSAGVRALGWPLALLVLAFVGVSLSFTCNQAIVSTVFNATFFNPLGLILMSSFGLAGAWFVARRPALAATDTAQRVLLWSGISLVLGLVAGSVLLREGGVARLGDWAKSAGMISLLLLSFFETSCNILVPTMLARVLPAHLLARGLALFFLLFALGFKAAAYFFGS